MAIENQLDTNKKPTVEYYDNLDRLQFDYPHYESPFRVSINPNFSRWMDRYCAQWAINNCGVMRTNERYVQSIQNSDLGFFAAVTFPTASWHRIEKLMKFAFMFFIADDYHDIVTQQSKTASNSDSVSCDYFWQHLIEMLEGLERKECLSRPEWPDFIKGIQSVMSDIYFDYTDVQLRRSVGLIKHYIQGNVLETEWFDSNNNPNNPNNSDTVRSQTISNPNGARHHYGNNNTANNNNINGHKPEKDEIPDWNSYMKARLGSVGGQMSLQLIEYAKDVCLTDSEFNHPLMGQLERAVSEEMTLVNDYLTFRKEVAENDYQFSKMKHAFPVLVNQGMTLQEAVNHVHQLIQDKDRDIFRLINEILNDQTLNSSLEASKRIASFVDGVNEFVGGYWRHAVQARRYHGANFKSAIPPEGHFTYDPNQTIINPSNAYFYYYRYEWLKEIKANVQPN